MVEFGVGVWKLSEIVKILNPSNRLGARLNFSEFFSVVLAD